MVDFKAKIASEQPTPLVNPNFMYFVFVSGCGTVYLTANIGFIQLYPREHKPA